MSVVLVITSFYLQKGNYFGKVNAYFKQRNEKQSS